jgi:mlo protein
VSFAYIIHGFKRKKERKNDQWQMGSTMKPTIFNERVVNAIRKWHQTAKKHIKQSRQSASTPSHSASPVHLLRPYKGDVDIFPTSPRMSGLNIEDCEMGRSHSPSRRHDRHGKHGQEERDAHELRPTSAREIDIHST